MRATRPVCQICLTLIALTMLVHEYKLRSCSLHVHNFLHPLVASSLLRTTLSSALVLEALIHFLPT
jgi:hypothetical protein